MLLTNSFFDSALASVQCRAVALAKNCIVHSALLDSNFCRTSAVFSAIRDAHFAENMDESPAVWGRYADAVGKQEGRYQQFHLTT